MIERRYGVKPGVGRPYQADLLIEAFGSMTREGIINATDEDLHSVFRERAELMGWLSQSEEGRSGLWGMHEAELTDGSQVGWAQVGLDRLAPSALPAALQCLSDAVQRFGATVSGFQVALGSQHMSSSYNYEWHLDKCEWWLVGVLNWFNLSTQTRTEAVIHFDQELLGTGDVPALVDAIVQYDSGHFEFRLLTEVPDEARVRLDTPFRLHSALRSSTGQGILVSMPEWTPSAAGWALAKTIVAAHALGSKLDNYAVRISRVSGLGS